MTQPTEIKVTTIIHDRLRFGLIVSPTLGASVLIVLGDEHIYLDTVQVQKAARCLDALATLACNGQYESG